MGNLGTSPLDYLNKEVPLMRRILVAAVACLGVFVLDVRGQDEVTPPSPREVERALREHKDAFAALRTAERALATTAKKLEALLKRMPPAPPAVYPPQTVTPMPAPAVADSVTPYVDSPDDVLPIGCVTSTRKTGTSARLKELYK
jgi:hypothetical protein